MTLPPVVRLFFAIDLPASIKVEVGYLIDLLKKQVRSNAIRWSKVDNLHITLQFLAEVKREDVTTLIEHVRGQVEGHVPLFTLTFDTYHLFPNPYRPRVIVINILSNEGLVHLSELIENGIQRLNYELDHRPFRPHLTLGRIKYPHDVNLNFLSNLPALTKMDVDIHEIVLFRSEPQQEGSVYIPLERIALIKSTK